MNTLGKISPIVCLICATLTSSTFAQDAKTLLFADRQMDEVQSVLDNEQKRMSLTDEDWKSYGERLTEALESENAGVQQSALRMAAYYGDKLQMGRRAAISAVRLYRDDRDPKIRKMAVVAIARINHPWGIDFLTRSIEFEDSTDIERTIRHALQEQEAKN
jgi:hypothetical protein